jgi:hypothetical protein
LAVSKPATAEAACFTVSNENYFAGTVALLNSLRLSGNGMDLVVLDRGFSPHQKSLLAPHSSVVNFTSELSEQLPDVLMKPLAHLIEPVGVLIILDSDMIVTRSLDHILSLCNRGKVCVYRDSQHDRWFPQWEQTLGLRAPLRRQDYVNSGFLAVAMGQWQPLLVRWWEVCLKVASGFDVSTELPDQDALNALLMSEVPMNALAVQPEEEAPVGGALASVTIRDSQKLICFNKELQTTLLHDGSGWPKPWDGRGWMRAYRDAYVSLLPRLLFAEDLTLRLSPTDFPPWLRPRRSGALALAALDVLNGTPRRLARHLPPVAQDRLKQIRKRFIGRLAR